MMGLVPSSARSPFVHSRYDPEEVDEQGAQLLVVYVTRSFSDSFAVFQQSQTKSAGFTVDHNWAFTLPGPLMPIGTKDAYEGVTGQVWGSHVYYESTKQAYKELGVTNDNITQQVEGGCCNSSGNAGQAWMVLPLLSMGAWRRRRRTL